MTDDGHDSRDASSHGGHGWLMIICCIPMIAIAVALVATGAASPGFLVFAVMCPAMMALMMRGMDDAGEADRDGSSSSAARPHHHP